MGVVYSAYDPQLQRRIALKLLRAEQIDPRSGALTVGQQRLLREAQALAKLSHPNVLSVFDAGIVDDQVFIATEFVEASTLRDWTRNAKRSLRETMDVFIAAGRGLAAAHARGIVHRDFKPHNVLIDGGGLVRVMDFGLATVNSELERSSESGSQTEPTVIRRDLDQSAVTDALTQAGMIVGTPGYMAPEQFLGEGVGPAADQFAFCVSLYEALFGSRPFQGQTIKEIGLAVCRGTITPSAQPRRLPKWLRRAILRGLHPQPEKRWASMDALLAELARDRKRRWVHGSAAVVSLGLAVVAGFAYEQFRQRQALLCSGSEAQLVQIWDPSRRSALKQAFFAHEVGYAQDMWERIDSKLENYASAWIGQHRRSCEATRIRGEQSERALDLQMGCLADRRAELRVAVDLFAHADEDVVRNAMKIAEGLSPVESCAGKSPGVDDEILDGKARERLTEIRARLGKVRALYYAGKYGTSIEEAEEAKTKARVEGADVEAASAQVWIGTAQAALGEPAKGYQSLLEGLWAADAAGADAPGAEARIQLAFVAGYYLGETEEGRLWARHAKAAIARMGDDGRLESKVLYPLGVMKLLENRPQDALDLWTQARHAIEQARGVNHQDIATVTNAIGVTLQTLGRYEEAREALEQATQIWSETMGPRYPDVGIGLTNLGNLATVMGEYSESLALHERAHEIFGGGLQPDHPHLKESNTYAAAAAIAIGDRQRARTYLERALTGVQDPLTHEDPTIGDTLHQLGRLAILEGEFDRAREIHQRAIDVVSVNRSEDHPAVGSARVGLARALLGMGKLEEARVAAHAALDLLQRVSTGARIDVAEAQVVASEIERRAGRFADAVTLCRQALSIRENAFGPEHPETAAALSCAGQSLLGLGRKDEARTALANALERMEKKDVSPDVRGTTRAALARSLPLEERPWARDLARHARDDLEAAGPMVADDLRLLDRWQSAPD